MKNERGAAVVELGVMLIALVPLIFYFFFISDLCYQIVNTQEATISAIWDYSTAPFGVYGAKMWGKTDTNCWGGVDNYNRMDYADHSSAMLDEASNGSRKKGRSAEYKHTRPWAELDWGNGDAHQGHTYSESDYYKADAHSHQIACQHMDDYTYGAMVTAKPFFSGGKEGTKNCNWDGSLSKDEKGKSHTGRYLCWARGEVVNYLIPKYFSPTGRVEEKEENQLISARGEGSNIDNRDVYKDHDAGKYGWLAFRNRASLVAGDWSAIVDHLDSHKDTKIDRTDDMTGFQTDKSYYYKKSQEVHLSFLALGGAVPIASYIAKLASQKLAAVITPTPLPGKFFMAATFSHSSDRFNVNDYKYRPPLDILWADELFTVSNREYLQKGSEKRGAYYLGAKQSLQ